MVHATENIRQAIVANLLSDRRVGSSQINVEITDHKVRLVGTVPSRVAAAAAEEDARGTRGVETVQNMIEIRPREVVSRRSDSDIRRSIRTLLYTVLSSEVPGTGVEVEVEGGTAVLRGLVDCCWARERAEELALMAKGARMIDNRIEVAILEELSDVQLQDRIARALHKAGGEALAEVHVEVAGRKAVLRGKVADRKGLHLARETASRIAGVVEVKSELLLA